MGYSGQTGYILESVLSMPTYETEPAPAVAPLEQQIEQPIEPQDALAAKLSRADQMLGRLDGILTVVPDRQVVIDCLIRIEALASARMEGKLATFAELVHLESSPDACDWHTAAAFHYVKALRHAVETVGPGQTLSPTNLRGLYEILHYGHLDEVALTAEVRRASLARSGVVGYMPSALLEKNEAFTQLEAFLRGGNAGGLVLLQSARQFANFPDVHTVFEDDGRMQRIVIPLLLTQNQTLQSPLLPLSPFLYKHRDRSLRLLKAARTMGDWGPWIEFFLEAVASSCELSISMVCRILARFHEDEETLKAAGMSKGVAPLVLRLLREVPYISPMRLASMTGHGLNAISGVLETMKTLGIVAEEAPRPGRMVSYLPYLQMLEQGPG